MQRPKRTYDMKPNKITLLCLALISIFSFRTAAMPADLSENGAELTSTGDYGEEYLDRMVFLGESTTTHLRSRGGVRPEQVWANASGTMKLDSSTLSRPIQDAVTGKSMTITEAAESCRPDYLVLSFGLNGITGFVQNRESYLGNYRTLIERIQSVSPATRIIVQSVYPVGDASCQTDWKFSVPPETVNAYAETLNGWLREFCSTLPAVRFVDTASVLRDERGFLRPDFTTDGIHLTKSAYDEILLYLRTHGWTE